MDKKKVNDMFYNQTIRKHKIIKYSIIISLLIISCISFFLVYLDSSKTQYVNYNENKNLDYKVYLKDNNFFNGEYLDANNQYIATLIDYITAEFKYDLEVEDANVEYKYSYYIDAIVEVKDKNNNKSLYKETEKLVSKKTNESTSDKNVTIKEKIKIDYNKYNDLIKRFINIYGLSDAESTLKINMYVSVYGNCDKLENGSTNKNSTITMNIPLTKKTVGIDMTYDLGDQNEKVLVCKNTNKIIYVYLLISFICLIMSLIFINVLIKYIRDTQTAESIYEKELRKILTNYKSYIQQVNNEIDIKNKDVLKVDSFTDLLEIRDTIQEPILMVKSKEKSNVYFFIPSKTNIVYSYGLRITDIRKKIRSERKKGK